MPKRMCVVRTVAGLVAGVLFVVGLAGCGGGPSFKMLPASGKVTYADGSLIPADRIVVTFVPETPAVSGKDEAGSARGEVNTQDGTFEGLTTRKGFDGVVPGKHKVTVVALKNDTVSNAVPESYQNVATTSLTAEVAAGKANQFEFKIDKPAAGKR